MQIPLMSASLSADINTKQKKVQNTIVDLWNELRVLVQRVEGNSSVTPEIVFVIARLCLCLFADYCMDSCFFVVLFRLLLFLELSFLSASMCVCGILELSNRKLSTG